MGKSKKPKDMSNDEWKELDARALSAIRLCLADEVLFNIVGETTFAGLWSKLESLYMTQSLTSRIFLRRKLYAMRMEEGTKITNHLNVFSDLTCQLTNLGDKFSNEEKVVALLCTVLKS